MINQINESCATCKFFKPNEIVGDGECRRHAPVMLHMNYGGAIKAFPTVMPSEFCGDKPEPAFDVVCVMEGKSEMWGVLVNGTNRVYGPMGLSKAKSLKTRLNSGERIRMVPTEMVPEFGSRTILEGEAYLLFHRKKSELNQGPERTKGTIPTPSESEIGVNIDLSEIGVSYSVVSLGGLNRGVIINGTNSVCGPHREDVAELLCKQLARGAEDPKEFTWIKMQCVGFSRAYGMAVFA